LSGALGLVLVALLAASAQAEEHHDHGHAAMEMSAAGMVMNQNTDQLPLDCAAIAADVKLVVHAGRKHAAALPGTMFAYAERVWDVPACSRVTVTLVNDDHVRHQWMLHGLPRYLYPEGMFHLEVAGPGEGTGTFIVPGAKKTYLVHCDVPQHTEKGMKGELKVGGGDGDLPSLPGVSAPVLADEYRSRWGGESTALALAVGLLGALVGYRSVRPAA